MYYTKQIYLLIIEWIKSGFIIKILIQFIRYEKITQRYRILNKYRKNPIYIYHAEGIICAVYVGLSLTGFLNFVSKYKDNA